MDGGLYDDILFGMYAPAYLMPLPGWNAELRAQAPYFQTMRHSGRRTIISRCKHTLVKDGQRTDLSALPGRAFRNKIS